MNATYANGFKNAMRRDMIHAYDPGDDPRALQYDDIAGATVEAGTLSSQHISERNHTI